MIRKILPIVIFTVIGCANNSTKQNWISLNNTDQFTDKKTCTVTIGSFYSGDNVYTLNNSYYPYIQKDESNIYVGVQSGGKVKIPVGNIQLRIDNNQAWMITPSETPLLSTSTDVNMVPPAYPDGMSDEQKKAFETTYKTAINNATKAMSPFTATSGDKAHKILIEMINGNKLIYRTVGLNQAASSTGEVLLDNSFKTALSQCGISL